VKASDYAALRHLHEIGVGIGSVVKVLAHTGYDDLMTIQVRGQTRRITLGPALTSRVYVEPIDRSWKGNVDQR
jgi:Fe2+ transport system protein FeoA